MTTLASVRVKTKRITIAYLRRRLAIASGTLVGTAVLLIGLYWAAMDSHQYLEVESNELKLTHGTPGMSGFQLPRLDWKYPIGPEFLSPDSPLLRGGKVTFERHKNPESVILSHLSLGGQATVLSWMGRRGSAREKVQQAVRSGGVNDRAVRSLLSDLLDKEDIELLSEQISGESGENASALIDGMKRLDPESAALLLVRDDILSQTGYQLHHLSTWWTGRGENTRAWLTQLLKSPAAELYLPAVAQAMVRAGCPMPAETVFQVNTKHVKDVVYALRLTDRKGTSELATLVSTQLANVLADELSDLADSRPPTGDELVPLNRLLRISRYLESDVVFERQLERIGKAEFLRNPSLDSISTLAVLLRSNDEIQSEVRIAETSVSVYFRLPNSDWIEGPVLPLGTWSDELPELMEMLMEFRTKGIEDAASALLKNTKNPQARLALVNSLREIGVSGEKAEQYVIPDRYDLEAALLRWLAVANPQRASAILVKRINETKDSYLIQTLGLVKIKKRDSDLLLSQSRAFDRDKRCMIASLLGSAEEVAALLIDPDPKTRSMTARLAPVNSEWTNIAELSAARQKRADPYALGAQKSYERGRELAQQIVRAPHWSRNWRAAWIDHFDPDPVVQLIIQRALDSKRSASDSTASQLGNSPP